MYYSSVALIPARSGSKRIPLKNIKTLGGHPLIAYAIQSARDAGFFDGVYVSSDSDRIGEISRYYGAKFIKRPDEYATDESPDSAWIFDAFEQMNDFGIHGVEHFAIVRPTSPFRTGETIKRAWLEWDFESILKAVEPVKQHPSKMWVLNKDRSRSCYNNDKMRVLEAPSKKHLQPNQTLRPIYVQNGSLEFRQALIDSYWGDYQPFFTEGYEGFDLNTENDWILAEALIEKGYAKLPEIDKEPYDFAAV